MGKLNAHKIGISLAVTLPVLNVACLAIIMLLPKSALVEIYRAIFHTLDTAVIVSPILTLQSFMLGIGIMAVLGYAGGYLFSIVYNKLG